MKNILKRLGLKADATEQEVDAAIEELQSKYAQASEAVAEVDNLVLFKKDIMAELETDNELNAIGRARMLKERAIDTDKHWNAAVDYSEKLKSISNALLLESSDPSEVELLAAIQKLKEQPSNGDSNGLAQRISEKEAGEKSKELFHQYPDEDVCFITSDGQGFFREQYARNHTAYIKGADFFKFER